VTLIRVVGAILAIALLTIPAAIGQQWAPSLKRMMAIAVLVSAGCTLTGLFLSYWLSDAFGVSAPPGPLIVLAATILYGLSGLTKYRSVRG
jgi:ABC-type Mn2+/Zn2+ transport system permease subunit